MNDKIRITITLYDSETFEFLQDRPLRELIDSTKETGLCYCVYSNNIGIYTEKTKAGYKISGYNRGKE